MPLFKSSDNSKTFRIISNHIARQIDLYISRIETIALSGTHAELESESATNILNFSSNLKKYRQQKNLTKCYILICKMAEELEPYKLKSINIMNSYPSLNMKFIQPHRCYLIFTTNRFLTDFLKESILPVPSQQGMAIIHRIWVGSTPKMGKLYRALHGNISINKLWSFKGKKVTVKNILWTSSKALLTQTKSNSLFFRHMEVRHIDELLDHPNTPSVLAIQVRSTLAWKQYSYSCDILRLLAVFHFGGLYLDMGWVNNHEQSGFNIGTSVDPFSPNTETAMICASREQNKRMLDPLTSLSLEEQLKRMHPHVSAIEDYSDWHSNCEIETGMMYAGRANHPYFTFVTALLTEMLSSKQYQKNKGKLLHAVHGPGIHGEPIYNQTANVCSPAVMLVLALQVGASRHLFNSEIPFYFSLPEKNILELSDGDEDWNINPLFNLLVERSASWRTYNARKQGSAEAPF